jgi:hypothetical protein
LALFDLALLDLALLDLARLRFDDFADLTAGIPGERGIRTSLWTSGRTSSPCALNPAPQTLREPTALKPNPAVDSPTGIKTAPQVRPQRRGKVLGRMFQTYRGRRRERET